MEKMKKALILFLSIFFLLSWNKSNKVEFRPIDLKCEYTLNPIGVDTDAPRFTWQLPSYSQVKTQMFYQLLVGTDSLKVKKSKSLVWDSGK